MVIEQILTQELEDAQYVLESETGVIFDTSKVDIDLNNEDVEKLFEYIAKSRTGFDDKWSPDLPSSNVIWRYLNFTQLLSILERKSVS